MEKNLVSADRYIRLTVAALIAILYFTNVITGTLAIIGLVVVGIFVLTSLINFCPLYKIIGVNTCKVK